MTTFIPMGAMYLHARMFYTLAHTSSIPIGAMYLYMQERFLHSLIPLLFPLRAPTFTMKSKVWPCANRAMVRKNLTVIIEVVIIEVMLIEGFLYNNKKVGAICRCHITFCAQNQYIWFSKFPIFPIYPNQFYVFLKCGFIQYSPKKSGFLLCRLFIKKNYYDRYYDINHTTRKIHLFHGLFTVSCGLIDPCDITRTSVYVFVTAMHSPSQL